MIKANEAVMKAYEARTRSTEKKKAKTDAEIQTLRASVGNAIADAVEEGLTSATVVTTAYSEAVDSVTAELRQYGYVCATTTSYDHCSLNSSYSPKAITHLNITW